MATGRLAERHRAEHVREAAPPVAEDSDLQAMALDAVEHGLCILDGALTILLMNRAFAALFALPEALARPGVSLLDLLRHWEGRDALDGRSADEVWRQRRALVARGEPFSWHESAAGGRIIAVSYRPSGDGRWIATHRDVTAEKRLEAELRAQADRFSLALDNTNHALAMFDAGERLIVCNAQYLRLFDYDPAVVRPGVMLRDILAHSIQRGTHAGRTLEELLARARGWRAGGQRAPSSMRLADGRHLWLWRRPMPGGGYVFTCEDVTDRERVADSLREQHAHLEQALVNMSQGLAMFGGDERLIVCNDRYRAMLGLQRFDPRPGTPFAAIIAEMERRGFYPGRSVDEVLADARRRIREGDDVTFRAPADGRQILGRCRPMPHGGWVFTCEDVTEREQAAAALREQHRRFDTALNAMSQGLCMFDTDNRLIVCNHVYVTLFNADPAVVKPGIALKDMFQHGITVGNYPGRSAEDLVARRLAAVASGRTQSYDQPLADGRTIACTIQPMPGGGWLGMFEDVTETRRAESRQAETMGALNAQNLLLDAALDNMAQGLCVYDADFRMVVRNRRYLDIHGLTEEEVPPGVHMSDLIRLCLARGILRETEPAEAVYARFAAFLADQGEAVIQRRLGERVIAIRSQAMSGGGRVVTFEDITRQEAAATALREQNRRFDAALNNMAHGLAMLDEELNLIVCNRRYIDMYALSPEAVRPGMSMQELIQHSMDKGGHSEPSAAEIVRRYRERLASGTLLSYRRLTDGRIFRVHYQPMQGGWVSVHEDVTESRKAEEHIAHLAHHDTLTGLPNRALFRQRMAEGLAHVEKSGEDLALLCVDLDHFKGVNDTLGHPVGDSLLTAVAQRLGAVVGEAGMIARLGGDEFAILLYSGGSQAAQDLARRLVRAIGRPFMVDGHVINTGLSIGIAVAPRDGTAADPLMQCADLALYRAKAEGRGVFRLFEPEMSRAIQARRDLELDLRQALQDRALQDQALQDQALQDQALQDQSLKREELSLAFQPQVDAVTCRLKGLEALVRWTHDRRGPVSPGEFIPIAEETGLILPLGEWVLRRACAEAARWPAPVRVAVNLSPVQFKNRRLVQVVLEALAESGLLPSRLELEITEAVLLQHDEATIAMLHELRAHGIRIAMDDFGIGYSSLSYLRSFPFDKIKIDRSFIADIEHNRDNAAIVRAMAGLGASLGVETTAEGVETPEQLAILRECGCSDIQGFLVSTPQPAAAVPDLIARLARRAA